MKLPWKIDFFSFSSCLKDGFLSSKYYRELHKYKISNQLILPQFVLKILEFLILVEGWIVVVRITTSWTHAHNVLNKKKTLAMAPKRENKKFAGNDQSQSSPIRCSKKTHAYLCGYGIHLVFTHGYINLSTHILVEQLLALEI